MYNELKHHGILGQKWGVRRYQNPDGSLTPAGIKRYATKQYAEEALDSNKSMLGKTYDLLTGAHKYQAGFKYADATKKQRKEAAEEYLRKNNTTSRKIQRGVDTATAMLGAIGTVYVADKVFNDGKLTEGMKYTTIHLGRAAISTVLRTMGHTNIRWTDNK